MSEWKYLPTGTIHLSRREIRGLPEFYCGIEKRLTTMVLGGFVKTTWAYMGNKLVCEKCLNAHLANLENAKEEEVE